MQLIQSESVLKKLLLNRSNKESHRHLLFLNSTSCIIIEGLLDFAVLILKMKQFLKQKFYGKLLGLLKYRRHKKIKTFISFSKKKIDSNLGIGYNPKNHQYYIESKKLGFFDIKTGLKKNNPNTTALNLASKNIKALAQSATHSSLHCIPYPPSALHNLNGLSEIPPQRGESPIVVESPIGKVGRGSPRSPIGMQGGGYGRVSVGPIGANECLAGKKKYKLNSFLFNLLCQFTKNRTNKFFGYEILLRYFTIPYRLSLSRFIGNKILRSYYKNLTKKTFSNLLSGVTSKAVQKRIQGSQINCLSKQKKEIVKRLLTNLESRLDSSLLRLLQFKPLHTKKYLKRGNKEQLRVEEEEFNKQYQGIYPDYFNSYKEGKVDKLEDSRPLLFPSRSGYLINSENSQNASPLSLLGWRKIKSPWKNFTMLQIKQKIIHGHVYVNDKKVKSPNFKLLSSDRITIKGFISNPLWNTKLSNNVPFLALQDYVSSQKKQLSQTFFLRFIPNSISDFNVLSEVKYLTQNGVVSGSQTQPALPWTSFIFEHNLSSTGDKIGSAVNSSSGLLNLNSSYIKNLKIKRFSEIFYLTYKNFFLLGAEEAALPPLLFFLKRTNFVVPSSSDLGLERYNNLHFYFQSVGLNQSIYFLWPLISMLSIQPWNAELKNTITQSALLRSSSISRSLKNKTSNKNFSTHLLIQQKQKEAQKRLFDLLHWKNLQERLSSKKHTVKPISVSLKEKEAHSHGNSVDLSKKAAHSYCILPNGALTAPFNNGTISNFSWLFNKNSFENCAWSYASVIYGTRQCKWIQLQQQKKAGFYNKLYNKLNFFELELDFFQLSYRRYKSY